MRFFLWFLPILSVGLHAQQAWKVVQYTFTQHRTDVDTTQTVLYITQERIRQEQDGFVMLLGFFEQQPHIYVLNLQEKTYRSEDSTLWDKYLTMLLPFLKCDPVQRQCKIDSSFFQATDQYRTVGGFKSRKVVTQVQLMGVPVQQIQWMTTDWKALSQANQQMLKVYEQLFLASPLPQWKKTYVRTAFDYLRHIKTMLGETIFSEATIPMGPDTLYIYSRIADVQRLPISPDYFALPSYFRPE